MFMSTFFPGLGLEIFLQMVSLKRSLIEGQFQLQISHWKLSCLDFKFRSRHGCRSLFVFVIDPIAMIDAVNCL